MNIDTIVESASCDQTVLKELIVKLIKKNGSRVIENIIDEINDENNKGEPILSNSSRKFTAFPIQYQNIWDLYKLQLANMWKAEEIDFENDRSDFEMLNDDEKFFIENILAFFAASDGIVNLNLAERFTKDVKITEALFAYQFQEMMENIHSHTYSLMLEKIVADPTRREFLFNAIKNVPSIKLMADWAFKWVDSSDSFAKRLIAFAAVEAIFFSGAFASIFWLKSVKDTDSRGKPFMAGLITSNQFIARDEGMHATFACELFSLLVNKPSFKETSLIIKDATRIAQVFMRDALPVKLIGMNDTDMCNYIEYIADRLMNMLGYKKIYNSRNPFKFMEKIGLANKTNFFEKRAPEYQDSHVLNANVNKSSVNISSDF